MQIFNSMIKIKQMASDRKLLLGPNGKIYHTNSNQESMGVINYPNQPGIDCGHAPYALDLKYGSNRYSLPKFIKGRRFFVGTNDPEIDLGPDQRICQGLTTVLNPEPDENYTYEWQDGSTNPSYTAWLPGNYSVTVTNECGSAIDFVNIEYTNTNLVDLGENLVITSTPYTIDAGNKGDFYLWQDGSTNSTLQVSESGHYWVNVTTVDGCYESDSIYISVYFYEDLVEPSLNLYPNPSSGLFILKEQGKNVLNNLELTIYDALGRELYSQSILLDGQIEINLTEFTQGMYFLHWSSIEHSGIFKLLVIR